MGVVLLLAGTTASWAGPAQEPAARTPPLPVRVAPAPVPSRVRLPALGEPRFLSAEEAVRLALEHQPDLLIPEAEVLGARGRTTQDRAGLLPTLDLRSSHERSGSLSGAGNSSEAQVSLGVRQLLWDFRRTSAQVAGSQAREEAARASLAAARADTAMAVRQAFHGLVAARELAQVARANLENRQGNLALARARWESGLGLPADVVRASSAVATATLNQNAALAREISAGVALARLLGLDPRTALEPVCDRAPAGVEGDLQGLVQEASQKRPEVLWAQRQVEAAEHDLRAARVNAAPSLSARAGLSARSRDYPPESWQALYALEMEWPLVDSGATAGRVQQARASLDEALARREVVRQDIASEIARSMVALQVALDSLGAAGAAESDAREAARIAEGRYGAGLGSFLEVLDAQSALLTASNQSVSAHLAAWEARAAFDRAVGRT